jgi:hypothetical protein
LTDELDQATQAQESLHTQLLVLQGDKASLQVRGGCGDSC